MSGFGIYDPTTIMNADQLSRAQKEGWIKLAFYLLSFFYYLYRWVTVFILMWLLSLLQHHQKVIVLILSFSTLVWNSPLHGLPFWDMSGST